MRPELTKKLILPPPGARVLCAVSGGADSMCLLALLRELGCFSLAAAHFEHGIRGEESLRDCAFVEEYCRENGVVCYTEHADVPRYAAANGLGLEEAAREQRYAFLERTAAERGYDWIATAHNLGDNAETVLLHLARGAGLAGLCGIPPRRGRILRPLLGLSRAEIEQVLRESGTPHVEDSSNGETRYSRNRIRAEVLPALRELNPSFEEAVARMGKLLRRDEEFLGALAQDFLDAHFDGESLPAAELLGLHSAVSGRVLRRLLPRAAEEEHIERALALCKGTERKTLDLPGVRLCCERGRLYFAPDEPAPIPETEIAPGACFFLPEAGLTIRCEIAEQGEEIHNSFKTYSLKYESISWPLRCSSPREGERYRPAKRGCTKTLRALFAEKKATQREKLSTPVFRDAEGVVLVPPFGAAERCAPSASERRLVITIEEINN